MEAVLHHARACSAEQGSVRALCFVCAYGSRSAGPSGPGKRATCTAAKVELWPLDLSFLPRCCGLRAYELIVVRRPAPLHCKCPAYGRWVSATSRFARETTLFLHFRFWLLNRRSPITTTSCAERRLSCHFEKSADANNRSSEYLDRCLRCDSNVSHPA